MPYPRQYENAHERTRQASARQRARAKAEREQFRARLAKPIVVLTASEAVELYRAEKAASLARNAASVAQRESDIRAAIARADAAHVQQGRGGRPKKVTHGPNITVRGRDPLALGREDR